MDNKKIYNFNLYLVYHIYIDLLNYRIQDINLKMKKKSIRIKWIELVIISYEYIEV